MPRGVLERRWWGLVFKVKGRKSISRLFINSSWLAHGLLHVLRTPMSVLSPFPNESETEVRRGRRVGEERLGRWKAFLRRFVRKGKLI